MFEHLRIRNSHELVEIINKLKKFDKIDRLMHSIKAIVSNDCYSVLKLNFNISNVVLLLIKATIDLLKLFIHLFESFIYLFEPFIYLFESSIYLLFYLFKPFIHLLLHFAKLRRNKFTLIKKLLLHSLIVDIQCST